MRGKFHKGRKRQKPGILSYLDDARVDAAELLVWVFFKRETFISKNEMLSSIILVIFKKVMTMMWEETSIHNFFSLVKKLMVTD